MNGISNKNSAAEEISEVERIRETFDKKIKETGKVPGTHTLGEDMRTKPRT